MIQHPRQARNADGDSYELGNVEPVDLGRMPRLPLVSVGQGTSRVDVHEEDLRPAPKPLAQSLAGAWDEMDLIPREAALVGALVIGVAAAIFSGTLGLLAGLAWGS